MKSIFMIKYFLFLSFICNSLNATAKMYPIDIFPSSIQTNCRAGVAKIYDECTDQIVILKNALIKANESKKSVLLVYGAEWCIWCHVFDKYAKGQSRKYDYEWEYENEKQNWTMHEKENANVESEAILLNKYISENFVISYIESYYSPNGIEAINSIGIDGKKIEFYPFFFVLNNQGEYAGHMLPYNAVDGLEKRKDSGEEFRGFNRKILLEELRELRNKSLKNGKQL